MRESIGHRIARFRNQNEWTQEQLALRVAVSRVAISHLELGLSIPSERTIALMASAFRCEPYDLVADTTYPEAKAERLPPTIAWYTQLDFQKAALRRDLLWLNRIHDEGERRRLANQVVEEWLPQVLGWMDECFHEGDREDLAELRGLLLKETMNR